jgi:hypothetical protein
MAGSCEHDDKPLGSGTVELVVSLIVTSNFLKNYLGRNNHRSTIMISKHHAMKMYGGSGVILHSHA